MSTRVWNKSLYIADTAALRDWGSGFQTEILALGLVSYGGIDWTTINKPTIDNTNLGGLIGSEIYGFADAKQATKPVFIQFTYYATGFTDVIGYTTSNRLRINIEVGFAHDGLGKLTGKKTVARTIQTAPYYSGQNNYQGIDHPVIQASVENRLSGNTSRLTVFIGSAPGYISEYFPYGCTIDAVEIGDGNNAGLGVETGNFMTGCFTIERLRDNDGVETEDGIVIAHNGFFKHQNGFYNAGSLNNWRGRFIQCLAYDSRVSLPQYNFNTVMPFTRASGIYGSKLIVFPFKPILDGTEMNSPMGLIGCQDFDFEPGINPNVFIYGANHTYYKTLAYNRAVGGINYASSRFLMLWE